MKKLFYGFLLLFTLSMVISYQLTFTSDADDDPGIYGGEDLDLEEDTDSEPLE